MLATARDQYGNIVPQNLVSVCQISLPSLFFEGSHTSLNQSKDFVVLFSPSLDFVLANHLNGTLEIQYTTKVAQTYTITIVFGPLGSPIDTHTEVFVIYPGMLFTAVLICRMINAVQIYLFVE